MADRVVMTAAERIEEEFGGSFKKLGADVLEPLPTISTGSLLLDEALNESKGYPEGCIVEIFGPQHSGKTLMGLLAIAECQRKHPDKPCLIIDAERQFLYQAKWAKQLGVKVEDLFHSTVTSAEEAFSKMEMAVLGKVQLDKDGKVKKVVEPGNFGIIMVDSVSQLVPLEEIHKRMDQSTRLASLAAAMGRGLRKVVSAQSLVDSKTTLIFINQTRANPNALFSNPEVRTGGNALPFYDTIAFRVSKIKKSEERDERNQTISHRVKVKFEKNKTGTMPADAITFKIKYDGTGVDNDDELFTVAEMNGLIAKVKRGKYNFIKPDTKDDDEPTILNDSIDNFKINEFDSVLKEHPKMKDMILKFIRDGSFYIKDDSVEEDNPDVSEEQTLIKRKEEKKEDKDEEKWELEAKKVEEQKTEENTSESEKPTRRRRRRKNEEK